MVGSAGFALASLPFAADLAGARAVGVTYFVGSIAFLASSALAVKEARGHRVAERVSWENMIGSIAFGVSAVAAYVVPDTYEALNASAATSFTLIGALLFFRAAQLLPRATS